MEDQTFILEERSPLLWKEEHPPVYVGSAGHLRQLPGPVMYPMTAYYIGIIWGVAGKMLVHTPEGAYELVENTVCLLAHGTRFSVEVDSPLGEFIYFSIDGPGTRGLLDQYSLWEGLFPGGPPPMGCLKQMISVLPRTGEREVRVNLVNVLDLLDLIRNQTLRSAPDKSVLEAETFIRRHWKDPLLSMNQVCDRIGVHRSGLFRKFKKYLKKTPLEYLHTLRTQSAVRHLRESSLSVSEIAYDCGFTDTAYFSRFLKKRTGFSPQEIRRQGPDIP